METVPSGATSPTEDHGPTDGELLAIEAEAPVIAAEVALVDAEIALITVRRRRATDLDWQRVRAAERAVVTAWWTYYLAVSMPAGLPGGQAA